VHGFEGSQVGLQGVALLGEGDRVEQPGQELQGLE
jgi:hypothetical protein